jgi:hypothetical protein
MSITENGCQLVSDHADRFRVVPEIGSFGWLKTLVRPGRRSKFRKSLDSNIC